jgi:hypothetical protein
MPILAYISDNTLSTERPVVRNIHAAHPSLSTWLAFFRHFLPLNTRIWLRKGCVHFFSSAFYLSLCNFVASCNANSAIWWLGGSMPLDLPDLAAATGTSMDGGLRIN